MPDASQAIYPDGPSNALGNQSPDKVLGTYPGNHNAALLWGEPQHREAYVAKYGYEKSLDVINSALNKTKGVDKTEQDWREDMLKYRDDLLARQSS